MNGTLFSNVNNIQTVIPEYQKIYNYTSCKYYAYLNRSHHSGMRVPLILALPPHEHEADDRNEHDKEENRD